MHTPTAAPTGAPTGQTLRAAIAALHATADLLTAEEQRWHQADIEQGAEPRPYRRDAAQVNHVYGMPASYGLTTMAEWPPRMDALRQQGGAQAAHAWRDQCREVYAMVSAALVGPPGTRHRVSYSAVDVRAIAVRLAAEGVPQQDAAAPLGP